MTNTGPTRLLPDLKDRGSAAHSPAERIANAEVFHYTRRDPGTGQMSASLRWLRRAAPRHVDGLWVTDPSPWRHIEFPRFSDADLLRS